MKGFYLFIVSFLLNIYQYKEIQQEKISFSNSKYLISKVNSIQNNILGRELKDLLATPLVGENSWGEIRNAIIIFSDLTGCGKCINHHLEISSKEINYDNFVYLFYAFNKSQVKQVINKYQIRGEVFWDEENIMTKMIGTDTKKINPFVLVVIGGKIINITFSYQNDFNYIRDAEIIFKRMITNSYYNSWK